MDASKGSLKYLIIQTIEYVLTTFKAYMSNMLTILRDQAYSVATIYHVMDKIRDTVSLLSPGPRTSACDHSRSANIWHSQTDLVAVTRRYWRKPIQPYFCRWMFTWFFFNRRDEHKLLLIQKYFNLTANSYHQLNLLPGPIQHSFQTLELTYNKYVKESEIGWSL